MYVHPAVARQPFTPSDVSEGRHAVCCLHATSFMDYAWEKLIANEKIMAIAIEARSACQCCFHKRIRSRAAAEDVVANAVAMGAKRRRMLEESEAEEESESHMGPSSPSSSPSQMRPPLQVGPSSLLRGGTDIEQ